jgi:serine/threonine protein kinase
MDRFEEDVSVTTLRKESNIMHISKHKNIIREKATFIDGNYIWIVMNIVDAGSLHDILKQSRDKK